MSQVAVGQIDPPLILSIDIGTSSIRTILYDRQGRGVLGSSARRKFDLLITSDGAVETDADEILDRTWSCIDETMSWAGSLANQIQAVATSTFVSNILAVDKNGRALTPLIPYSDTRPSQDVHKLRQILDEEIVHQRTGCHFHPSYLPARFLWVERTHPELLRQDVRWISIGEYMLLRLFNRRAVSYSVASWTGLLNRQLFTWDDELLQKLPVDKDVLSPLVDYDSPTQGLEGAFSERWPALRDIPWFPAVGDGASANIGSGCTTPGQVAITMGTTTALRAVIPSHTQDISSSITSDVPFIPKGLWCYQVDRENSLIGGALTEGGNIWNWMKGTLQLSGINDLEGALLSMTPAQHGLVFLPLLGGERSPGWIGEARGILAGISLATSPLDILRAGLEGVALRTGIIFQLLCSALPGNPQVIASGGALLHSPAMRHILADVLGQPMHLSGVEEASARGAAILALKALNLAHASGSFPTYIGDKIDPDLKNHQRYRQAIQDLQDLYHTFYRNY